MSKEQRDITGLKLSTKKTDPFCVKPFSQDHEHPMSCGTIRHGKRLLYSKGFEREGGNMGKWEGRHWLKPLQWNKHNVEIKNGYKTAHPVQLPGLWGNSLSIPRNCQVTILGHFMIRQVLKNRDKLWPIKFLWPVFMWRSHSAVHSVSKKSEQKLILVVWKDAQRMTSWFMLLQLPKTREGKKQTVAELNWAMSSVS